MISDQTVQGTENKRALIATIFSTKIPHRCLELQPAPRRSPRNVLSDRPSWNEAWVLKNVPGIPPCFGDFKPGTPLVLNSSGSKESLHVLCQLLQRLCLTQTIHTVGRTAHPPQCFVQCQPFCRWFPKCCRMTVLAFTGCLQYSHSLCTSSMNCHCLCSRWEMALWVTRWTSSQKTASETDCLAPNHFKLWQHLTGESINNKIINNSLFFMLAVKCTAIPSLASFLRSCFWGLTGHNSTPLRNARAKRNFSAWKRPSHFNMLWHLLETNILYNGEWLQIKGNHFCDLWAGQADGFLNIWPFPKNLMQAKLLCLMAWKACASR